MFVARFFFHLSFSFLVDFLPDWTRIRRRNMYIYRRQSHFYFAIIDATDIENTAIPAKKRTNSRARRIWTGIPKRYEASIIHGTNILSTHIIHVHNTMHFCLLAELPLNTGSFVCSLSSVVIHAFILLSVFTVVLHASPDAPMHYMRNALNCTLCLSIIPPPPRLYPTYTVHTHTDIVHCINIHTIDARARIRTLSTKFNEYNLWTDGNLYFLYLQLLLLMFFYFYYYFLLVSCCLSILPSARRTIRKGEKHHVHV